MVLAPDASVREAATRMFANQVGSVLVVDGEELLGIVTERDFTELLRDGLDSDETTLDAITSSLVETIALSANVEVAISGWSTRA